MGKIDRESALGLRILKMLFTILNELIRFEKSHQRKEFGGIKPTLYNTINVIIIISLKMHENRYIYKKNRLILIFGVIGMPY